MPEYKTPGVYIEEVDRGSKPIEAVGTSTVGFLGTCNKGPVNKPVFITNWSQHGNTCGDFRDSDYLAHAVYGFFNNGGSRCFVCNVGSTAGAGGGKDENKLWESLRQQLGGLTADEQRAREFQKLLEGLGGVFSRVEGRVGDQESRMEEMRKQMEERREAMQKAQEARMAELEKRFPRR